jgi:hypothetical protein
MGVCPLGRRVRIHTPPEKGRQGVLTKLGATVGRGSAERFPSKWTEGMSLHACITPQEKLAWIFISRYNETKVSVAAVKIYTVGHSNRREDDFISLLEKNDIKLLVDVRAFPSSKKYPHFNKKNLIAILPRKYMEYLWFGRELGGYRKESEGLGQDSPNTGWEAGGFRVYADYMLTDRFKMAADHLVKLAEAKKTAILCAEKFYWRCHRRLISDFLQSLGHDVCHIIDKETTKPHQITQFARVKDARLTYASPTSGSNRRLPFP